LWQLGTTLSGLPFFSDQHNLLYLLSQPDLCPQAKPLLMQRCLDVLLQIAALPQGRPFAQPVSDGFKITGRALFDVPQPALVLCCQEL